MKSILAAMALIFFAHSARADDLSLVEDGSTLPPLTRLWWTDDANHNNEYNYSTTAMWGGSSLNVANQWGDVVISNYMTGPYGNSPFLSVDLHFVHNGTGYAEAALGTTQENNNGYEPLDFADRDAGKAINPASVLKFTSPGTRAGVFVKLVDANGRSSQAVSIDDYRGSYGRYTFDYTIPVSAFVTPDFDLNAVKNITYFVDDRTAAGEYPLHLLIIKFDHP